MGKAHVRGGPALDRALKGLSRTFASGRLGAGEYLPSERALAKDVGVARGTLRAALDSLARSGVIRASGGRWVLLKHDAEASLMAHTIGILTVWDEQPLGGKASGSGGWERYVAIGAADAVRAAGLHTLALYPERLTTGQIRRLLQDLPRGIVVSTRAQGLPEGRAVLEALAGARANVVVYGNAPEVAAYPRVASDHADGAYQLTRWLIVQGRRRILRVWPDAELLPYWLRARDAGYERAMREAGLDPLPPVGLPVVQVPGNDEALFSSAVRTVAGHLFERLQGSQAADALMADTDGNIFTFAAACRLLGKRVHEDVAVVGYDNYWAESPLRRIVDDVPAATIDKLNRKIGNELVRVLLDRDVQNGMPAPDLRLVKPRLVVPDVVTMNAKRGMLEVI